VVSTVRGIGGDLRVESDLGAGTRFVIEVPVARRGERVVTVRVASWVLAIPAAAIRSYRHVGTDGVPAPATAAGDDRETPTRRLAEALAAERGSDEGGVALDCTVAGIRGLVVVDEIVGEEEVFIRQLPAGAGLSWPFEGVALLASGRPVPVVSVRDLLTGHGEPPDRRPSLRPGEVIRVLLVDDSRVTREMLRRLLEDGGLAVTAVGGAGDALERLRESRYDCVVTDIEMPGMDGLELTRELRTTAGVSDLPVVVVSTRDRPGDRLAGLDAGADAYLTKQGLDARELISCVLRLGGRR
jgi:CheY-like chemotaxis protein